MEYCNNIVFDADCFSATRFVSISVDLVTLGVHETHNLNR